MALIHGLSLIYGITTLMILVLTSQVPSIDKLEAGLMSLTWPALIFVSMLVMFYNITLDIIQ